MGSIGDTITQPIPAVGTSGTQYASDLVNFLTEVKTRLQAKVPLSSVLVSAIDLANNPLQNASYVSLYPTTGSPVSPVGSIQNFAGDFFWVSPVGAVQITTGGSLNAAGIGGITGDYGGANPAQFRFVDADKEYYAYDNFAGGAWAKLWARNFDIAAGDTSAVRARLAFSGGASYTFTLPAAVPATQKLLQMDGSGNVLATNTLANNENITLQGTGKLIHGTRAFSCGFSNKLITGTGALSTGLSGDSPFWSLTSGGTYYIECPLVEGTTQVISYVIHYDNGAGFDPTVALYKNSGNTTMGGAVVPTSVVHTTNGAFRHKTLTVTTPASGNEEFYYIKVTGVTSNLDIYKQTIMVNSV